MKKLKFNRILINIALTFISVVIFIIPLLYVISISISDPDDILFNGFSLIPENPTLSAYKFIFSTPDSIINAYIITIIESFVGMFFSVLITSMLAYTLSRSIFEYKKSLTWYVFFTMLFSGGLIPTYILNTTYLHLGDTIWIYILPGMVSAWNVILFRTFFRGIPEGLIDAAVVDGASEWRIFFQIMIPLSKPVFATIALTTLLGKWNEWYATLIYIDNEKLYTLQYLLQKMLRDVDFIKAMATEGQLPAEMIENLPGDNARYAMCVVAAGPMLFVFPFFQKYFSKGLTVGAIKG